MSDARQMDQWSHTAQLLAMMANTAMKAKKTRPFEAKQFFPFHKQVPRRRLTKSETKNTLRAMAGVRLKGE